MKILRVGHRDDEFSLRVSAAVETFAEPISNFRFQEAQFSNVNLPAEICYSAAAMILLETALRGAFLLGSWLPEDPMSFVPFVFCGVLDARFPEPRSRIGIRTSTNQLKIYADTKHQRNHPAE